MKTESFSSEWFQRNMARMRSGWCSPRSDRSKSAEFSGDQMVRAEVGVLSAQAQRSWPHSRHLPHSRVNILIKYLFRPLLTNPLHPWNEVLFTSSGTHSIPIVFSCHHRTSQPPHLSEGPPHSLSGTMARRLGNRWLLVFVGSAGRQLDSAQLLLYHLLHHTLQRLKLACRCIPYVALYCISFSWLWISTPPPK